MSGADLAEAQGILPESGEKDVKATGVTLSPCKSLEVTG